MAGDADTPKSLDNFSLQQETLDRVLGLQPNTTLPINFSTPREAIAFRLRCYGFRKADRKRNAKVYPVGHELHGKSAYDPIVISLVYDEEDKPTNRLHACVSSGPTFGEPIQTINKAVK